MTSLAEFQFGEWLPDRPDFKNPGCTVAENVVPVPGGYGPIPSLTEGTNLASGVVTSAYQFFDADTSSFIVGAVSDSLFRYQGTMSVTTGLAETGEAGNWDFCKFKSLIVAAGVNNDPHYLPTLGATTFEPLPGSPPKARFCAAVGDFVVLGNIPDGESEIHWSAFNDPTATWGQNRRNQSGSAVMPKRFGPVRKIVGGRYGMVFQHEGISRLSYVGPPSVFRRDTISEDIGCIASMSVVSVGYKTYFLGQDGFYVTNGTAIEPISSRRVKQWFFNEVDEADIFDTHAAVDWENQCIWWAFRSSAAKSTDRAIIYNWTEQRWSYARLANLRLVRGATDGITLDDLDTVSASVDSLEYSLDSDEWKFKARKLSAFYNFLSFVRYGDFSGSPMEAKIETGEFQPSPKRRVFVSEVTPLIEADTWDAKITLNMRDNRGAITSSSEKETGWSGFAPVRGEGQKMSVQMIKPTGSNWDNATGVQVRYTAAGYR